MLIFLWLFIFIKCCPLPYSLPSGSSETLHQRAPKARVYRTSHLFETLIYGVLAKYVWNWEFYTITVVNGQGFAKYLVLIRYSDSRHPKNFTLRCVTWWSVKQNIFPSIRQGTVGQPTKLIGLFFLEKVLKVNIF